MSISTPAHGDPDHDVAEPWSWHVQGVAKQRCRGPGCLSAARRGLGTGVGFEVGWPDGTKKQDFSTQSTFPVHGCPSPP